MAAALPASAQQSSSQKSIERHALDIGLGQIAMRLLGQATCPVDHEAGAHREPEILCCHAWP